MEQRKTDMRRLAGFVVIVIIGAVFAGDVSAQGTQTPPPAQGAVTQAPPARARQGQGRALGRGAAGGADAANQPIALAELQRLFDAYFLLQAQDALKLDDAKFAVFLPRLKALQDARRRHDVEHRQAVGELARLTAPDAALDENQVREKLRALQEIESRAAAETRKAYDGIDQVLDVRQQARFRVFEQNMERRKLDLMLRARRGEGPGAAGPVRRP
jgi:hypothetical protein